MKLYLQIALRNLLQARRRSAFLGIALALVTMLLVLLLSLSAGIRDNLIFAATSISTGHVNVNGFYKATPGDVAPIVTDAPRVKEIVEAEIDGIEVIIDRGNGFGKIVSASGSMQSVLQGVDVEQEARFLEAIQVAPWSSYAALPSDVDLSLDGLYDDFVRMRALVPDAARGAGDALGGDPARLAEPGTALLFAEQARRLGVAVGNQITVTSETMAGTSNTADVTVVAVAEDIGLMSSWYTFYNDDTLRELYQLNEDTTGSILLYLDDIERADEVVGEVRAVLADHDYELMEYDPRPYFMKFEQVMAEDWTGQRIDVTKWEDEVNFVTWILTAVDTVSFILVTVLSIIIVIGIMNTMWITVRERTREVGTLRAIGMRKRQVLALFMTEALLLGGTASLSGGILGALLALAIDAAEIVVPIDAMRIILMSDTITLSVHVAQVVTAVIVFTVLTALSAAWPSIRASRLQPVTAIHHIE